ncbi:AMP-binding protein [Streptomyces sp. LZ34]
MRHGAPEDPYVYGERIDRVIARWGEQTPHAVAVQQGDRCLSYAELTVAASRVAGALRLRGVGPGAFVPTLMDRSPELVIALLGIMRAGAACVPLDRSWAPWRIDDLIDRAAADVVIADPDESRVLGPAARVTVDALLRPVASGADGALAEWGEGTDAACVVLASGSTGRPTGAVCPHRALVRALVGAVGQAAPVDRSTRFLQSASPGLEAFAAELWLPLLHGGSSVLAPARQGPPRAEALRAATRDGGSSGFDGLLLPSALFHDLAEEDPGLFDGVRVLAVTGAPVSAAHARAVLRRAPGLHLLTGYGPAAASMFATTFVVGEADVAETAKALPLGRATVHTDVVVLGEDGRALPAGETGELVVGGHGVARGLLGDPDTTASGFFESAGELIPPGRYCRTGDLGWRDERGNLWFEGRRDGRFRAGGSWLEPSEIEAVLEADDRIDSCVVFPCEISPGAWELGCLHTTPDGLPLPSGAVQDIAAGRLTGARIPTLVRHVPRLPLAAALRVDLQALADEVRGPAEEPLSAGGSREQGTCDPLLDEVRGLLDRPALRPDDDLLDAGISSLDAVRLAARLSLRSGTKVTVADVYGTRRLSALWAGPRAADTPSGTAVHKDSAAAPAPPERTGDRPPPLSHAQKRFLFTEFDSPGDADNLVVRPYVLSGPLREDALRGALGDVVRQHPGLRTIYPWQGSLPVQRAIDPEALRWETVPPPDDCRHAPPDEAAERITEDWWRTPFRLDREIPLRARLCRVADERALLCLQFHHIAFDDWSESLMLADLRHAYERRSRGESPSFPPNPGYGALGGWEERHLADWAAQDMPYWTRTLAECPAPFLPEPARPDGEAAAGEAVGHIDKDRVERLTRAARRCGGPPLAALTAATGLALAREFGVEDLCLGALTAGRFDAALDPVVGFLVNPFAVPLHGLREPPDAVLAMAARRVLDGLEHAKTPFDELVRVLRPDRRRSPWFQAWVVLQNPSPAVELGPDLTLQPLRTRWPSTARAWMIQAIPTLAGGWDLVSTWREDVMDAGVGKAVMAGLERALAELAGAA